MNFVRRNEDRKNDEREIVKKMEVQQEDMARMHTSGLATMLMKLIIWLLIIYVAFKVIIQFNQ